MLCFSCQKIENVQTKEWQERQDTWQRISCKVLLERYLTTVHARGQTDDDHVSANCSVFLVDGVNLLTTGLPFYIDLDSFIGCLTNSVDGNTRKDFSLLV